MKIECNPRGLVFNFLPETSDEYYTLKLIYDNQTRINTDDIGTQLIKRLFKYTIEGREVTAEEFISYFNKVLQNSAYGKLATDYISKDKNRKFITVHKYDNPKLKASIAIDQIQAVTERDDGYASIRLATCKYDTCDKYEKIIKQLS